ncbi:hypothetical protein ACVIHI_008277 [Bradyrhizobium sp. USDA 4524]|uniref:hypothetical protein n=1 Tax=unclassified Bradyrhizobium TaxID=2631580 RepID=UPI00209FD7F7|nr:MULTISPECIES: hypothetical protein [unclassified Bradyrhizobium]MCP1838801.1 hypothetical protein [Bradyrhizobium sp. USDA 4538]MCP1899368.1 hypothetical protein [Bradyrhizobium sp. USDA 4537]MCP1986521.1 hypothetical protein [Bradyrhizobium sp. USDA 4539]
MNPTWFWDAATKMVGQYAAIVPFFLLTDIVSNESSNFLEDELSWARMGQPMMEFLIAPMRLDELWRPGPVSSVAKILFSVAHQHQSSISQPPLATL